MKKLILLFVALLCTVAANAQSMKMVVDSDGEAVGRYVKTKSNSYTVEVQDVYDVPKTGHRVVTFSAANGKGVVYRDQSRSGNINVRKGPGTKYPVVAQMTEEDDLKDYPDNVCDCLGKKNGWYKISIKGKVGYVRQDLVLWAAYYAD
jgi:uncharacterized protein YgiM (DUF1202 family)